MMLTTVALLATGVPGLTAELPTVLPDAAYFETRPSIAAGLLAQEAEEAEEGEKPWTGSVSAGASVSSGNSNITTYAFDAQALKEWEESRLLLKSYMNFGEQEVDREVQGAPGTFEEVTEKTQDRYGASGKYDHFLTEKTYALASTGIESDALADLNARLNGGAGLGYQFYDDEEFKLRGEAGLSYIDENRDGTADDVEYVAARLSYGIDWVINEQVTFGQSMEVFPSLEDKEDVTGKLDTRFRVSLSENMFAQLQHVLDYDNTPSTDGTTGDRLKRADQLVVLTVGWSF